MLLSDLVSRFLSYITSISIDECLAHQETRVITNIVKVLLLSVDLKLIRVPLPFIDFRSQTIWISGISKIHIDRSG